MMSTYYTVLRAHIMPAETIHMSIDGTLSLARCEQVEDRAADEAPARGRRRRRGAGRCCIM